MEGTVETRPQSETGGQDTKEQAKEQVQEKAQQVADRAQEGMGQAREQVRRQVDERSTQAGQQVRSAAGDARSVAEQLRSQGRDQPARVAEQAADRAERLGGYLERASGEDILRDVEDYARRNPWAVVAGGVALGFTLSRMLKASSGERYRQGSQQEPARLPGPPAGAGNGAGGTVETTASAVPGR
ncbi:MAG: hypothetical protein JW895_02110 [Thermoleophilaceae bacterium]|nr:hypothetical protein [Thermoleophilaceae bacterium]